MLQSYVICLRINAQAGPTRSPKGVNSNGQVKKGINLPFLCFLPLCGCGHEHDYPAAVVNGQTITKQQLTILFGCCAFISLPISCWTQAKNKNAGRLRQNF